MQLVLKVGHHSDLNLLEQNLFGWLYLAKARAALKVTMPQKNQSLTYPKNKNPTHTSHHVLRDLIT